MPFEGHSFPEGVNGRGDWLGAGEPARMRPWAYEEILFGSAEHRARAHELAVVVGELEAERVELSGLHDALDLHLGRISELERRLAELRGEAEPQEAVDVEVTQPIARPTLPHPRTGTPAGSRDGGRPLDGWSHRLTRCEGFDVDAPGGPVGFVEGLRFGSRIDCPDFLEVRGGRFGRQLLLIPIDEVAEIHVTDHCVTLRSTPVLETDLLDDLGGRLRRVLHFDQTAS